MSSGTPGNSHPKHDIAPIEIMMTASLTWFVPRVASKMNVEMDDQIWLLGGPQKPFWSIKVGRVGPGKSNMAPKYAAGIRFDLGLCELRGGILKFQIWWRHISLLQ